MGRVKVGVIGCGSIAKNRHFPEYEAIQETEIIAVCDIVQDRANTAKTKV